ncbi:Piso0_000374 [Millerozyma farinosa CBS 7064]|uniref:cysteine synthase n=1 Tax=Pichia sorbitophila (strain ATCC MYA-4447 / BCRC 22081 / CBS 7064 / NBRC 10061 / NRRL Y-12695) TaxID=559304 RepID=G8YV97_PICSO|nr:Piso0_000374 [Millerozyma farinosa CBS 7064]CCE73341.1 Piso0_000374 [Millerozyma farinosa CBS 7064]
MITGRIQGEYRANTGSRQGRTGRTTRPTISARSAAAAAGLFVAWWALRPGRIRRLHALVERSEIFVSFSLGKHIASKHLGTSTSIGEPKISCIRTIGAMEWRDVKEWQTWLRTGVVLLSGLVLLREAYEKTSRLRNNKEGSKAIEKQSLSVLRPRTRGVESLIGNTPMIEIKSLSKFTGCKIYAKLELMNPAGSAKDRVALAIIRANEKMGRIRPHQGDLLLEGTSGSTGISFAVLANALGYTAHICLPDDTSPEKMQLLRSLGAELEPVRPASIVDPKQYTNAARLAAQRINEDPNDPRRAIFADQFENDFNWRIHYNSTGPEIWRQSEGDVDVFINGSGTGGTIAGVSRYLKEKAPETKIILADPQGSGLANRVNYGVMYDRVEKEGTRRRHQVDTLVEGIGLNRLTWNFQQAEDYIDEAIRVSDDEALKMAKFLCVNDGLFWGSSSAINCVAALKTALKLGPGKKIVVIACDSGARHLSKFWKKAADIPNDIGLDDILA